MHFDIAKFLQVTHGWKIWNQLNLQEQTTRIEHKQQESSTKEAGFDFSLFLFNSFLYL